MKKSLILLTGTLCLSSIAQAGNPVGLRQGESRRFVLHDGRSILISCTRNGGRQTAAEIPLAAGRSTQITLYRDHSPTIVSCDANPRPLPPRPQPPRPNPNPNPRPGPPIPHPGPSSTEVVIFSNSDSCQGTVSGYASLRSGIDILDQCQSQLTNPGAGAWSVRTNGQCRDISDTNAISACAQTILPQHGDDVQVTMFSNNDACSGKVSASAIFRSDRGQTEQCQALASRANGGVWSVRVGNSCQDISDTNVLSACMNLTLPNNRPTGATEVVIYSSDDRCSGNVSASASLYNDYDLQDQCSNLTRLSTSNSAWSIRVNGQCRDIADTDAVSACLNVRVPSYRGARQLVIYSGNDQCSGAVSAAGYIEPRYSPVAQCQALKQNGNRNSAWSVRVDDRCMDIQDTDIVSACIGANL